MAVNGKAFCHGSATHPARVLRNHAAAVYGLPMAVHANAFSTAKGGGYGVVNNGDLLVTTTGGLGYSVAAGHAVCPGTFALGQGAYTGYNDAAVTGNLAAHSAFIRHDLICYRVRDTDEDATGSEDDSIHVVQGIANATDPAIPASLGSLVLLSRAVLPATSGTVTYTDLRMFASAIGGKVRCNSSTRPTALALYPGLEIFERDTLREMMYNGSAWEILSEPTQTWALTALGQPGPVAGTASNNWYQRSRGSFTAHISMAMTGAGIAGNNITVSMPLTVAASGGDVGGGGWFFDNGNTIYLVAVRASAADHVILQGDQQGNPLGTSPSFAIASGDQLHIDVNGRYA